MIEQLPVMEPDMVAFRLSSKLSHADYQAFLPQLEACIEGQDRLSVLFELDDLHGWDFEAAWDWLHEPRRQAAADSTEPAAYRQILVGVDFSPHAQRAGRRALQLARSPGSTASGVIASARCDVVTVRVDGNDHELR